MPTRKSTKDEGRACRWAVSAAGEDIGGVAVFLASDNSRYTTGSVVGADGGQAVGYFLSVPGRRFSGGRMD